MSDARDQEGWGAPVRAPLLAAAATLVILLGALILGGRFYAARLAPGTRPPPIHLPQPQLETIRSTPNRPRADNRQPPPAGLARAMAETAAEGDALWGSARP